MTWAAFERTIVELMFFSLQTCCPLNNQKSIPANIVSKVDLDFLYSSSSSLSNLLLVDRWSPDMFLLISSLQMFFFFLSKASYDW